MTYAARGQLGHWILVMLFCYTYHLSLPKQENVVCLHIGFIVICFGQNRKTGLIPIGLLINSSSQSDDLRGVILFGKLYLHLDKIGLILLYNEWNGCGGISCIWGTKFILFYFLFVSLCTIVNCCIHVLLFPYKIKHMSELCFR